MVMTLTQAIGVVLLACLAVGAGATTPRDQARITSLPGQDFQPSFEQYSGYITVDAAHGRNLFYWFQLSQNNPATDPVVMFMNGGPGCSSIGGGAMEENGAFRPYVIDTNSRSVGVTSNPWSWNRNANMIFVDSPAGVGFSYSDDPADYVTDNNKTAADSTTFLEIFFTQVFPDFANNTFWITGESYAGVYIPYLAYNILQRSTLPSLVNNLLRGGLMLGNPVTGCQGSSYTGDGGVLKKNMLMNMFYWHAMVSPRVYTQWNDKQCNTATPPSLADCNALYNAAYAGCGTFHQPLFLEMHDNVLVSQKAAASRNGQINPDCLYYSFCVGNATLEFVEDSVANCYSIDDQIADYLNNPAVQTALHARPTKWKSCGGIIFNQVDENDIIPYLQYFFSQAPSMRILYYSGDIDINTVPFGETFRCLETLNRPVVEPWRPWGFNQEIAGYIEIYDTYSLATLKGAGHEAPAYQPASAYNMFLAFMNNQPFPKA